MSQSLSRYKYGVLAVAAVIAVGASYLVGEEGDEGIVAKLASGDDAEQTADAAPRPVPAPRVRERTTPRSEEITPEEFYGDPESFLNEEQPDQSPDGLTEEYNKEGSAPRGPITPRIPDNLGPPPADLAAPPEGDIVMINGAEGPFQ